MPDIPTTRSAPTRRELLLDVLLAVGLALVAAFLLTRHPGLAVRGMPIPVPRRGGPDFLRIAASPVSYMLVTLSFLPLALRRLYPGAVLVVVAIAASWYQAVPNPPSMVLLGVLIALYSAGTLMDRRRLLGWGSIAIAIVLATALPDLASDNFWPDILRNLAVLLTAALLGDATRNRRAYVAEVEQRAVEAERSRDEEARRRVDEERLRIARELHDITAHSLAVIAVQSGAAAHVLDTDPAEARRSLVAIRKTSRESLQELRAMLGVLRSPEDDVDGVPLAPAGGLGRLTDLVGPLEDAGLTVTVTTGGELGDLSAVVDASAYRIVQESLTNVLRHAGKASVAVSVRCEGDTLHIEVEDDGSSVTTGEEGHGIAGMRERASALGGTFQAGPRPEGGWRVAATLPVAGRQT
jgi:signal transduction histidine kinase